MCWSGQASAVLAVIGFSGAALAAYKKEPVELWGALAYFSLMEILQAFTYMFIDDCSSPANQVATLLGYLHITFQPFFLNALSMYFIPSRISEKIKTPVYVLCFISAIYMLLQVYPFDWAGECTEGRRALCGSTLCSVSGNWHIAWQIPLNGIGNSWQDVFHGWFAGSASYRLVAFVLPFIYGSWKMTSYSYLVGPFLAGFLTNNINERPAVWCLLSIGILLIVVDTPIRKLMFVKKWFLWPKSLTDHPPV